jgi:hypothetical protein
VGDLVLCAISKMKDHTLLVHLTVHFIMFAVLYLEFIPCVRWGCTMPGSETSKCGNIIINSALTQLLLQASVNNVADRKKTYIVCYHEFIPTD